jgi:phosphoribosylglycinamide formyltransferase 1
VSSASSPLRVVVLASGRGSNLQMLIAAQQRGELPIELTAVFSDRAEAPALERARDAGISAQRFDPAHYATRRAFDAAVFDAIDEIQPGLIVCAGYMRLISAAAVRRVEGRMINIHPSLLPRHPGLDTHARALAAGDALHGASTHFVIPALDAGPVIAQVRLAVHGDDSAESLAARVLAREHALLRETVACFAQGRLRMRDGMAWCDDVALHDPLQLGDDDRLAAGGIA